MEEREGPLHGAAGVKDQAQLAPAGRQLVLEQEQRPDAIAVDILGAAEVDHHAAQAAAKRLDPVPGSRGSGHR